MLAFSRGTRTSLGADGLGVSRWREREAKRGVEGPKRVPDLHAPQGPRRPSLPPLNTSDLNFKLQSFWSTENDDTLENTLQTGETRSKY